jgi:hypothetical protein
LPSSRSDRSLAEVEATAETSEILAAFRQAARREDQRFREATDSEHWIALCFQTRAQKEEFLRKVGWMGLGDKYIDGMTVAEALGMRLDSPVPPMPRYRRDADVEELTR